MIIDCIGCLHGALPELEGGDLLIVTGDLTASHTKDEFRTVNRWLSMQDYKCKVLIGGNHDSFLYDADKRFKQTFNFTYLCDSGIEFQGMKIWGSPWSASFEGINPKAMAFTVPFGPEMEEKLMDKWELIPSDTDILITHSPPFGILDGIPVEDGSVFHVGSTSLYGWLKYVERPRLHVFSHVHEGYGQLEYFPSRDDTMMKSVNCSIMNERYKPVNAPIRIVL